ncbi:MAG: GFA family protein [Steroidobacteraceae bacterium]
MITHAGGCHCGRVRFEVLAPANLEVADCNCSICRMTGYLHLIVPADRFTLISGRDALTTYTFNTRIAQHYFCAHCGIKSFYVPRSHPECISVNVRCIDSGTIGSTTVIPFDGREWEKARAALSRAGIPESGQRT